MEDNQIIALYFARSEDAIVHTDQKYGSYCRTIAFNIVHNELDTEECVNDTYLKTWNVIPPRRPNKFSAFLGKITRNLALDRYRYFSAEKRGAGEMPLALDEMTCCVPSNDCEEQWLDRNALTTVLNRFLTSLPKQQRMIFMRRYWYVSSIQEIADDYHLTESKVKMSLMRSRSKLKSLLQQEGIAL